MLAVVYDVHGNLPALEAVLEDAEQVGADSFFLGGDYVGMGAWPEETLARLQQLENATWIRGNWERWQAHPEDAPDDEWLQRAIAYAEGALGGNLVAELAALEQARVYEGALYCHASPQSDMRSFFPEPAEDEDELIDGVAEPTLVFGHTHLQFSRTSEHGILMLNPGSVGLPFDGDRRAAYALIDENGGIELRRVGYDSDAAAMDTRARMGELGEPTALRLEAARFDVEA
ncbi:MAG TPA: metallophosphoesterase family protein [Thermoleophilaceae bacterium]